MRTRLLIAAPALALASVPALADCKEEIKSIMDRASLAGPYRTEATVVGASRRATMTSDVVPPGDLKTRTVVDGKSREVIKIANQVWANDGQGWKELPPAVAARISQVTNSARTLAPNLVGDAQCPGDKVVDGKSYTVYTYKMDVPGGKVSATNTLYVDPASRLPARVLVETRSANSKTSTDMRYVYDASIKLVPPVVEQRTP